MAPVVVAASLNRKLGPVDVVSKRSVVREARTITGFLVTIGIASTSRRGVA